MQEYRGGRGFGVGIGQSLHSPRGSHALGILQAPGMESGNRSFWYCLEFHWLVTTWISLAKGESLGFPVWESFLVSRSIGQAMGPQGFSCAECMAKCSLLVFVASIFAKSALVARKAVSCEFAIFSHV